jgi:hypothetical protein
LLLYYYLSIQYIASSLIIYVSRRSYMFHWIVPLRRFYSQLISIALSSFNYQIKLLLIEILSLHLDLHSFYFRWTFNCFWRILGCIIFAVYSYFFHNQHIC